MPLHAKDFIEPVAERIERFRREFIISKATDLLACIPDGVQTRHIAGEQEQIGFIDVVIEGGGVKGIATLGALYALEAVGLRFRKIAGTSSGALIAAFLAAAGQSAAEPKVERLIEILADMDFLSFADGGSDARMMISLLTSTTPDSTWQDWMNKSRVALTALRNLNEMIQQMGLNPGGRLLGFLCNELAVLNGGIPLTVGELKRRWALDPVRIDGKPLEQELQVVATDISHRQRVIFPRELAAYVHNPDSILIGDLVRASTSIPFFFAPVRLLDFSTDRSNLKAPEHIMFLDGGIVSNFPLSIFDVPNTLQRPLCPTFGLLIDEQMDADDAVQTIDNPVKLGLAMFMTAIEHGDKTYIKSNQHNAARIIRITNTVHAGKKVTVIDFNLSNADKIALFENGVNAVLDKLATWNFKEYIRQFRSDTKRALGSA
jgi:NTE family protein